MGYDDGLQPMLHEEWASGCKKPGKECKIPPVLLEGSKQARACVADMLADDGIGCMVDLKHTILKQQNTLLQLDPTFKIELEWLKTAADQALCSCIERQLLDALPDHDKQLTMAQTIDLLKELQNTRLHKWSSRASQSLVQGCCDLVGNLQKGIGPGETPGEAAGLWGTIFMRLAFLHQCPGGGWHHYPWHAGP